mgnify:CR=1 FL=1
MWIFRGTRFATKKSAGKDQVNAYTTPPTPQIKINAIIMRVAYAGYSLKSLIFIKWLQSISPYLLNSLLNMNVIKKPESTKKMSTPMSPFANKVHSHEKGS